MKFVRTYVLFGITVSALTSLMFGLLAVIMHNQALITMYYIFLFAVPILSATHIVCTHLWDDGNMAVKTIKTLIPKIIELSEQMKLKQVAIPLLGTGTGGLPAEKVHNLFEDSLPNSFVEFFLYTNYRF